MESLQHIKRRIKGVQNINQITKAMELVAATKMRRSQAVALESRPYAFAALELLANLARLEPAQTSHPLLEQRPIKKRAIVVVASDKGLAGSFNSSVIRDFEKYLRSAGLELADPSLSLVAVGGRAAGYLEKRTDRMVGAFTRVGDFTTIEEIRPLADFLIRGYLNGDWDQVTVFSTHFRSALVQEVLRREILPVNFANLRETAKEIVPETGRWSELRTNGNGQGEALEYLIEPSAEAIVEALASHLVLMQIYHLILEANASEHAARRVAMKNASDNAEELAGELTVLYNKSRQASITKEIIEIVSGAESLK